MSRPCPPPIAIPDSRKCRTGEVDPMTRPAAGPGWYESTWELVSGLEVIEVLNAEPDIRRRAASAERLSGRF